MANIWKDKKTGKWYESTDFIGTEFTDEITDQEVIDALEESERLFDEACKNGWYPATPEGEE